MLNTSELTPCGAMFDTFKRYGRIKHSELAELVLSSRQLPDGRSPRSRASDRTWVSRFIVHAPIAQLQDRYFVDYSVAALHIANRLRTRRMRAMSDEQIIAMIAGEASVSMERALIAARQDVQLYRNALQRLLEARDHTVGERAEAALVLFVAVGCSGDVRRAVAYTMDCARVSYEMETSTPSTVTLEGASAALAGQALKDIDRPFGLMRTEGGFLAGDVHWIDPTAGAVLGALAMGEGDITDVAADVSGKHARVFRGEAGGKGGAVGELVAMGEAGTASEGGIASESGPAGEVKTAGETKAAGETAWLVEDLGSKNGTALVSGVTGERQELAAGNPVPIRPGDELHLGSQTVYVAIEGAVGL